MADNTGEVTARGQRAGRLNDFGFPKVDAGLDVNPVLAAEQTLARGGLRSTLVSPPEVEGIRSDVAPSGTPGVSKSDVALSLDIAAGAPTSIANVRQGVARQAAIEGYESRRGSALAGREARFRAQDRDSSRYSRPEAGDLPVERIGSKRFSVRPTPEQETRSALLNAGTSKAAKELVGGSDDYDELTTAEGGVSDIRSGAAGGGAVGELMRQSGALFDPYEGGDDDWLMAMHHVNRIASQRSAESSARPIDPRAMTRAAFMKRAGITDESQVPEIAAPKPGQYERIPGSGKRKAQYKVHVGGGEHVVFDQLPGDITIKTESGESKTVKPTLHDPYSALLEQDNAPVPDVIATMSELPGRERTGTRRVPTVPGGDSSARFARQQAAAEARGLASGQFVLPLRMPSELEDITVPVPPGDIGGGDWSSKGAIFVKEDGEFERKFVPPSAVRRKLIPREIAILRGFSDKPEREAIAAAASAKPRAKSMWEGGGLGIPQPESEGKPVGKSLLGESKVKAAVDPFGGPATGPLGGSSARRTFAYNMEELMRQAQGPLTGQPPAERPSRPSVDRPRDTSITDAEGLVEDQSFAKHSDALLSRFPQLAESEDFKRLADYTFFTGRDITSVYDPESNRIIPGPRGEEIPMSQAKLYEQQGTAKTQTPGSLVTTAKQIDTPSGKRTIHDVVTEPVPPVPTGMEMTPVGKQRYSAQGAEASFRPGEVADITRDFLREHVESGAEFPVLTNLRERQARAELDLTTEGAKAALQRGQVIKTGRQGAERVRMTRGTKLPSPNQGEDTPQRKSGKDMLEVAASYGYIKRSGGNFVEMVDGNEREVTPERAAAIILQQAETLKNKPDASGLSVVPNQETIEAARRINAGKVSDTGEVTGELIPTQRIGERTTTIKGETVKDGRTTGGVTGGATVSDVTSVVTPEKAAKVRRSASAEARRQTKITNKAKRKPKKKSD